MSQKADSHRITHEERMERPDLVSKSDEELMRHYKEGEEMAFSILFQRHSGRVLGFLAKKLSSLQSAQDLTQDVFLKLHRSRMQYVPTLPFAPWLFSITRSVWLDSLKKKREELMEPIFLEKLIPATEPVFESSYNDEFVGQLIPNQRTAVSMKVYDDATFEDIALRLGTSTQNARQLVSRGLKKLREVMGLKKD